MKKIIFLLLATIVIGCGAPKYHDIRDYDRPNPTYTEERRFSPDPLLNSIMTDRYNECLRRCSEGKTCK